MTTLNTTLRGCLSLSVQYERVKAWRDSLTRPEDAALRDRLDRMLGDIRLEARRLEIEEAVRNTMAQRAAE